MYKPMETRSMETEIARLLKLRKAVMYDNDIAMTMLGVGKCVAVETVDNVIKRLLDLEREYNEVCHLYKYVAEEAQEYERLTHDITPDDMDDVMKDELEHLVAVWTRRLYAEEATTHD